MSLALEKRWKETRPMYDMHRNKHMRDQLERRLLNRIVVIEDAQIVDDNEAQLKVYWGHKVARQACAAFSRASPFSLPRPSA